MMSGYQAGNPLITPFVAEADLNGSCHVATLSGGGTGYVPVTAANGAASAATSSCFSFCRIRS